MKLKIGVCLISLACFSQFANADILFHLKDENVCQNLNGHWTGNGAISLGAIKCTYSGNANVHSNPDNSFDIDLDLNKESGICPPSTHVNLNGICDNGVLTMRTDTANLNGTLNASGTAADVTGTIVVKIGDLPITANVDRMHLDKQ